MGLGAIRPTPLLSGVAIRPTSLLSGGAIRPTSLLSGGAIRPTSRNGDRYSFCQKGGLETVPVPVSSQKKEALLASRGLIVDDHHPLLFGCVPEGQWITRSVAAARWFGGQRFVHHRRVSQCGHPAIGADKDALGEGVGRIAAVVGGGNDRRRAALRIPKSTIPTRSLRCLERILKVFNKKPSGISWEELRRHTAGPKRIQTAFITARPALDSLSARLPIAV